MLIIQYERYLSYSTRGIYHTVREVFIIQYERYLSYSTRGIYHTVREVFIIQYERYLSYSTRGIYHTVREVFITLTGITLARYTARDISPQFIIQMRHHKKLNSQAHGMLIIQYVRYLYYRRITF